MRTVIFAGLVLIAQAIDSETVSNSEGAMIIMGFIAGALDMNDLINK